MKIYRGTPGETQAIGVIDGDNAYILAPKNPDVGFAWGNPYEGAAPGSLINATPEEQGEAHRRYRQRNAGINQLMLAILTDLFGNEEQAVGMYQRIKHRTALKWRWGEPWSITEHELRGHIESIEQIERESEFIRRSNYPRDVVMEGGGGVVWDTDVEGRRIGPR